MYAGRREDESPGLGDGVESYKTGRVRGARIDTGRGYRVGCWKQEWRLFHDPLNNERPRGDAHCERESRRATILAHPPHGGVAGAF